MDLSMKKQVKSPLPVYIKQEEDEEVCYMSTQPNHFLLDRPYPVYPKATSDRSVNPVLSPKSDSGNSDSSKVSSIEAHEDMNYRNNMYTTPLVGNFTRPFKAINPLGLPMSGIALSNDSAEEYSEFRQRMLAQVRSQCGTNLNMRRTLRSPNPQQADPTYVEKRKRNNEAAKRSRDAKRAKEDEIAIRCAFLENENLRLKIRLASLVKRKEIFKN